MSLSVRPLWISFCVTFVLLLATGCGVSTISESSGSGAVLPLINGRVHGGQQAVSGATIQLYAANTTTLQGASTALLPTPATTDSNGNFNITGQYTCPSGNALVYIVSTGGNPGLSGSVNNTGIAMMSLLGSCNTLVTNAATTFIDIDELTTVVAVEVLSPFMSDYLHVGSTATGLSGIGAAFVSATSEINFSTGQFNGSASYLIVPYDTVNTLADILASCVNTSSSASSNCSTLFSNTSGSSNTIAAALVMAQNPAQNTTPLYNLVTAVSPFQPYFTSVPSDFTSTVGYAVPSFFKAGTVDSNGQLWLYLGGYNYDPSTNTSTDSAGYIQVYDNNFNALFTVQPGTGGLYYPTALAPDANGHVFAVNANNSISEFGTTGAAISPAAGWPTGFSTTFSPTGTGNNSITNANQAGPIQVDALGNIWGVTPSGSSTCYFEMNSSGTVITPTGTFCSVAGITSANTASTDGSGDAWALGNQSIAKVNAQGTFAATASISQGCFYPQNTAYVSGYSTTAAESITTGLRYDHVNNHLWGYSNTGVGAITNAGAAVFCDFGSTTLPVLPAYSTGTGTVGSAFTGGGALISNGALDGAGNFWFVVSAVAESGVVASSTSGVVTTFTGTGKFSAYLGEISAAGALLTPYTASTQTYGLQPAGFGSVSTASATNAYVTTQGPTVNILGIDRSGNIFVIDTASSRLLKITGLAVANTVNY